MKKIFLLIFSLILVFTLSFSQLSAVIQAENDTIKLGYITNRTGGFATTGIPCYRGAVLAVHEINEYGGMLGELESTGGLLGKQIELIAPDAQSDTDRFVSLARTLFMRDNVDVLMISGTSAAREAVRPVARREEKLLFYNTAYEGGVADRWNINTGLVPEQGFATLVEAMVEEHGPKVYILSPDYVWGELGSLWTKKYVEEFAGEVVGSEIIPLEVSDFTSSLDRIERENPDWIMLLITGDEQMAFFEQRYARGMTVPMANFVITIGQQGEHVRIDPPILEGLFETVSYVEDIPTDHNLEFVDRYRDMFPEEVFITQEGQYAYFSVYLWAKAVEKAGTVDSEAVLEALRADGGMTLNAPQGEIRFDPKTNHLAHPVHLIRVNENHELEFIESWDSIEPFWLQEIGVNLMEEDDNRQYSPLDM